jgi:hypothetical protein
LRRTRKSRGAFTDDRADRTGKASRLMFDLGMLAIAAACFAVILAILYGLDRI